MVFPYCPSQSTAELLNANTATMRNSNIHVEETEHHSRARVSDSNEKHVVQTSTSSEMPAVPQTHAYIGHVLVS